MARARKLDVERIRCSAEGLFRATTSFPAWPEDEAPRRRELRATALLLTESMAPDAYAAARDVLERRALLARFEALEIKARGEPPHG